MSLQFSTFDPQKLDSHPGVRSDLFNRPLDRTLVTDFFGGVSQAEIILPSLDEPAELVVEQELRADAPSATTNLWRRKHMGSDVDFKSLKAAAGRNEVSTQSSSTSALRAWGSSMLILTLVSWTAATRNRRPSG